MGSNAVHLRDKCMELKYLDKTEVNQQEQRKLQACELFI
jgi:hypothetical protein